MGNRPIPHEELRELRRKYDVHESGRLTLADVQRLSKEMCARERVARPPPAHYLQQIFDKLDHARQGSISADEFDAMVFQLQKLRQDRKSRGQAATPPPPPSAARAATEGRAKTSTPPPPPQSAPRPAVATPRMRERDSVEGSSARAAPAARSPRTAPSEMLPPSRKPSTGAATAAAPSTVRPSLATRRSVTPPPSSLQAGPPISPPATALRGMAEQCVQAEQIEVDPLDSPFTPSRKSEPMDSPLTPSRSHPSPRGKEDRRKPKSKSPRRKSPRETAAVKLSARETPRSSFGFFSSLVGSSEGPPSAPASSRPSRQSSDKALRASTPAQDTEDMASTLMGATTMLGETFSSMFSGRAQGVPSASSVAESARSLSPACSSAPIETQDTTPCPQGATTGQPRASSRGRRSVLDAIRQVESELGPRRSSLNGSASVVFASSAAADSQGSPGVTEASQDADSSCAPPTSGGEGWHRSPPTVESATSEAPVQASHKRRLRCADRARPSVKSRADDGRSALSQSEDGHTEDSPQAAEGGADKLMLAQRRRHLRSSARASLDVAEAECATRGTSTSPRPRIVADRGAGASSPVHKSEVAKGDAEVPESDSDASVSARPSRPSKGAARANVPRSLAAPSAAPRRQSSLSPRSRTFSTSPQSFETQAATQPYERREPHQRPYQSRPAAWGAEGKEPDEPDGGSSDESISDFVMRSRGSKVGVRQSATGRRPPGVNAGTDDTSLPSDVWAPLGRHSGPDDASTGVPSDVWSALGGRSESSLGLDLQDWAAMGIGPGSSSALIPSPRATSPVSVRSKSSVGSSRSKGTRHASESGRLHRSSSQRSSSQPRREGRHGPKQKSSSGFLDTDEHNPESSESMVGWLLKGVV